MRVFILLGFDVAEMRFGLCETEVEVCVGVLDGKTNGEVCIFQIPKSIRESQSSVRVSRGFLEHWFSV